MAKTKRLGAGVTGRTMTKRILFYFDQATAADIAEGSVWYANARGICQDMSNTTGFPLDVCAAVVSALSPQTRWDANVNGAWALLTGGERTGGMLGSNWARGLAVLTEYHAGRDPLGPVSGPDAPKIFAFALAILSDTDAVVVDIWAARVALLGNAYAYRDGLGDDVAKRLGRTGVYNDVANAYRRAANARGVTPCAMQATVWGVIRGRFS